MKTQYTRNPFTNSHELFTTVTQVEADGQLVAGAILRSAIDQAGTELARELLRSFKTNIGYRRRVRPIPDRRHL